MTWLEPVVDRAEELTPNWLTNALEVGGHDLTVASVAAERIGTGQIGTTFRLQLDYAGRAGPATLVAKLAGGDQASRAQVAPGYASEVGFYTHLAPSLDVRTPRCWYGAIADDKTRFTLLLDDVVGASPGVQVDGCTVTQARAAIANLVGLHAPRWNDPTLRGHPFLMRSSDSMAAMMGQLLPTATEGFVGRFGDRLTDGEQLTLREAARVIGAWLVARPEPFTVLHGDYRLDNLLFSRVGDDVVAVDWQTAALGPPMRDVAYFLGTSLDTAQRRAQESQLVGEYHSALEARGVGGYGADQCWDDYRFGHLQAPMVTVLGCMYASGVRSEQADAMFLAMTRRGSAAIEDLGSLDLV